MTSWRVRAVGRNHLGARLAGGEGIAAAPSPSPKSRRPVYLHARGGMVELEVYEADAIAPGARIAGPALIESATFTTLLLPGHVARVDGRGNYLVAIG